MRPLPLLVLALLTLSGCQAHSSTAHLSAEQRFQDDSARIETFTDEHPWSDTDVSGDIGDAVIKIDALERMGPAYLRNRDDEYAAETQGVRQQTAASQKANQQRIERYEQQLSSSVHKRPMGSFGTAYFQLYAVNQFAGRTMKASVGRSGLLDGVFTLDMAFQVSACNDAVCFATADTGLGQNSTSITLAFMRPVPRLAGNVVRPSYIEVLGEDATGTLVVRVLAPLSQ